MNITECKPTFGPEVRYVRYQFSTVKCAIDLAVKFQLSLIAEVLHGKLTYSFPDFCVTIEPGPAWNLVVKFVNDEADGFFFLTNDEYESKFEDVNDKGLLDKCGECGVIDFLTEFGFCEDCQEQLEADTIRQYNSSK